jgi:ABC-type Fe3+-citrate transport system substrate-binding protein
MHNASKIVGVSFVALLLLIGAGCNSSSADRYGKEMMKDHNGDMMMDDSRMQGIMMKDGQMMTEWEGGVKLNH